MSTTKVPMQDTRSSHDAYSKYKDVIIKFSPQLQFKSFNFNYLPEESLINTCSSPGSIVCFVVCFFFF